MSVSPNMELRHLTISQTLQLSQILDNNESWKSLMEKIPRNLADIKNESDSISITRKYSAENIQQIDETSKQMRRSPTTILLDEWGTSGRKRATVSDLLDLLVKVQLFRAADFVAMDILNSSPPERPVTGPAAKIDISLPPEMFDEKAVEELLNNAAYPDSSHLVGHLDSIINDNNRDYSISASIDHGKRINELFPNSSEEYMSESDSHSDLIEFSARTVSSSRNNNPNDRQSHQTPYTVFSPELPLIQQPSNLLIIDDSSVMTATDSASEWSADDNSPQIPANINLSTYISATESKILTKQYSHSIDSQVNSSLIPDIENLKIRNDTNGASVLSVSNNEKTDAIEVDNESYIPMLSLLNGKS
ncbi:protein Tube [Sitodiplosis mosellana]|uniref:protein Tube n=1 Tax=Sitodiplosis mosellana TaxID=263140 RepID=UPI002443AB5C|nr:protein Tube [Sitodiplosis mosellana]